jgi:ribose transport system substrate-binding protein
MLALTACGTGSTAPVPGATSAAGQATAESSCQSQVSALVANHLAARQQDWFPASSPKGSLVKGKDYWVIDLTTAIPSIADFAYGFKSAAEALGAKVTVFDGQGTPTGAAQGVDDAVAAHADGIVTVLIDPRSIASAVGNAEAAGIPIIEGDTGAPFPPFPPGVAAAAAQNQVLMGGWEADSALQLTGCELHAVVLTDPGNVGAEAVFSGIQAEIKKYCPVACSTVAVGMQAEDIATQATGDVENALRLHPDTNAIIEVADPYEPFVATALAALGSKVPVITASAMGNLAGTGGASDPVAADIVFPPALSHGWYYMQAILDLASGQRNVSVEFPIGLVNKSDGLASDPSSYSGTSPFAGFQAKFGNLWGAVG